MFSAVDSTSGVNRESKQLRISREVASELTAIHIIGAFGAVDSAEKNPNR